VRRWFGNEPESKVDEAAGAFLFFDALPLERPVLTPDVMTPHMGDWYAEGGKQGNKLDPGKVPADWHDPVPVPFLVVKQASFLFSVAPREGLAEYEIKQAIQDMPQVMTELGNALTWLGIGAKTAVGYGRMSETTERLAGIKDEIEQLERKESDAVAEAQKSPFEREMDALAAQNSSQKAHITLYQLLIQGHWEGDKQYQVAEYIKELFEEAKEWRPDFAGKNRAKQKQKDRTLKIMEILAGKN
jgi:CRISPR-associated protein Cmr6